ncbi:MAG: hypothetical protein DMG29_01425 [Acidobacteria bacterium]|nr:MAG: hypothetical protein DMG29_01425 [Acidobacteriota bacterium]
MPDEHKDDKPDESPGQHDHPSGEQSTSRKMGHVPNRAGMRAGGFRRGRDRQRPVASAGGRAFSGRAAGQARFEARTIEPIVAADGNSIPAWTKLKGQVSYVRDNQMVLRFDRIEPPGGKVPLVATVTGVVGEKNVKNKAGDEGEIQSASHRGRDAAIGAAVLGGIGAAVGATQGGGKGAAIGAATGGATGAVIGAAAGGPKELVLREGTRLELQLDRPLFFRARR